MSKSDSSRGSSRRSGQSPRRKSAASSRSRQSRSGGFRWWSFLWRVALVGLLVLAGWLVYLDATVRSKFEGKRWAVPAKVYARPLEIYDGQALTLQGLQSELALLGYRKVSRLEGRAPFAVRGSRWACPAGGFGFPDGQESSPAVRFRIDD